MQTQDKILHSVSQIKLTPNSSTILIYKNKNKSKIKEELTKYCKASEAEEELNIINDTCFIFNSKSVEIQIEILNDSTTKQNYIKIKKEFGSINGYRDAIQKILKIIL